MKLEAFVFLSLPKLLRTSNREGTFPAKALEDGPERSLAVNRDLWRYGRWVCDVSAAPKNLS